MYQDMHIAFAFALQCLEISSEITLDKGCRDQQFSGKAYLKLQQLETNFSNSLYCRQIKSTSMGQRQLTESRASWQANVLPALGFTVRAATGRAANQVLGCLALPRLLVYKTSINNTLPKAGKRL